jgi:hypothetical protein
MTLSTDHKIYHINGIYEVVLTEKLTDKEFKGWEEACYFLNDMLDTEEGITIDQYEPLMFHTYFDIHAIGWTVTIKGHVVQEETVYGN